MAGKRSPKRPGRRASSRVAKKATKRAAGTVSTVDTKIDNEPDDVLLARWGPGHPACVASVIVDFWDNQTGRVRAGEFVKIDGGVANWLMDHGFVASYRPPPRGRAPNVRDLTSNFGWLQHDNARRGDAYFDYWRHRDGRPPIARLPLPDNAFPLAIEMSEERIDYGSAGENVRRNFRMSSAKGGPADAAVQALMREALKPDLLPALARANDAVGAMKNRSDASIATELLRPACEAASRQGARGQLMRADAELIKATLEKFLPLYQMWKRNEAEDIATPVVEGRRAGGKAAAALRKQSASRRHEEVIAEYERLRRTNPEMTHGNAISKLAERRIGGVEVRQLRNILKPFKPGNEAE
jgi:hypothetical protein